MRVVLDPHHCAPVHRSMAPATRMTIRRALLQIGEDPMNLARQMDFKKLDVGRGPPVFRVRVGEWRICYTIDAQVVVLRVFHRSDGYGWTADLE